MPLLDVAALQGQGVRRPAPRSIQLGPAKGFLVPFMRILWDFGDGTATVWYTTTIGPDKVHIHRRFQDDLRQADAAIGVIW